MDPQSDTSPWTTRSSREVYSNPWISVREDAVVRPDGEPGVYGVVSMRHPSVFVVALTDENAILMVSLYRYATRTISLEVPAGGCDGEEPLVAAQRELLEETGYEAASWLEIGRMNALNGVCDAPEYVFLAHGLVPAPRPTANSGIDPAAEQSAEGISEVRQVAWNDAMAAVADGTITDGETVAALMYAALALDRL